MTKTQQINIRCAWGAMKEDNYLPILTDDWETLESPEPNPEEAFSKAEIWAKLPKESYYILQLIYHAPTEVLEYLAGHPGGKYVGRLTKYIQSHFNWKPGQIQKYLAELKEVL